MDIWAILKWIFQFFFPVLPPAKPKVGFVGILKGVVMQFQAQVTWALSSSPGITSQQITVTVNGAAQPPVTLAAATANYSFMVNEKDLVMVSITATDGVLMSAAATATAQAPEVTPLAPPTNVQVSFKPVS